MAGWSVAAQEIGAFANDQDVLLIMCPDASHRNELAEFDRRSGLRCDAGQITVLEWQFGTGPT